MWVLHRPEDCNNRNNSQDSTNDDSSNGTSDVANRAIAEMNNSDSEEDEDSK
jgi:hypothetical protein